MTWEYVRTCWKFRNDEEHGNNQDPVATQKDKLIRKILWMKTKILHFPNNYLRNLTIETLRGLPITNPKMTESQFEILVRANQNGQENVEGV
jgi:hypothetical protein